MKQKDIALIIVIAFVSALASFLISGKIFVAPKNRQQKVEVVDVINSTFQPPSPKYFNSKSIDPTQLITISSSGSANPFNGASSQ